MQILQGKKINASSSYPVKERGEDDLQFVPHILAVDLKVVLRVGQILSNLTQFNDVLALLVPQYYP